MLADFGIARAVAGDAAGPSTGQGVAVGTPTYMSPEQAAGEEVDGRSDLYALGIVAYEMLAGRPPFTGPAESWSRSTSPSGRRRSSKAAAGHAAATRRRVMRALEKHPSERWQTGEEFRQALVGRARDPAAAARRGAPVDRGGGCAAAAVLAATIGLVGRSQRPPTGVNPRHSMLVLPFDNLRDDRSVDWLREGSVSMLALNLSQWNDLTVVDHERLHDLLAHHRLKPGDEIGLDLARRLAREAGVWTVVLGDFTQVGDSLHLVARMYDVASGDRVDVARVDDRAGADARPLFDDLAVKLLDLSGAPQRGRDRPGRSTTGSLEAYRAYLNGVELLNRWDLAGAERDFRRATSLDTTFGLAYYRLALTRGWLVGVGDSIADNAIARATAYSERLPAHDRTVINAYRAFLSGEFVTARESYQQLIARDAGDADAWYGLGEAWFHDTAGGDQSPAWTQAIRAFRRTLALDPEYALAYEHVQAMLASASSAQPYYALVAPDSFALAEKLRRPDARSVGPLGRGVTARADEALATARSWVTTQPTTLRAHAAMVDAYVGGGELRRRAGRGGSVQADGAGASRSAVRGRADPLRLGRRGPCRRRAPHGARHRRPAGFPALSGRADASSATSPPPPTSSPIRETWPTPPRRSTWPTRCGRKSFTSPRSRARTGGWRRSALGDLYAATGGPAVLAAPGVAERRRGGPHGLGGAAEARRAQRRLGGDRALHRTGGGQQRAHRVSGDDR